MNFRARKPTCVFRGKLFRPDDIRKMCVLQVFPGRAEVRERARINDLRLVFVFSLLREQAGKIIYFMYEG